MEVLNYQDNDASYENKILQLEKEAEEMINTFYFVTDQINQLQNEQQKLKQKVLSIKHQIKSLMKQVVPQSFPNKRKKPMDGFNTDITLFTPNGNMIFTSEQNGDSQPMNINSNMNGNGMNPTVNDEKMRDEIPTIVDKKMDNLSSIAEKIEINQCKNSNTYLTVLPDINPTQFSIDIKDDLFLQKLDYLLFEKNWRSEPTNSFFIYATSIIETYFKTFFPSISHNTLVLKLQNLREKEISTNNYVQIKDVYLIYHQGLCFSENKINIDNLQFWHEKKLKTSTMIGNVQLWSTTVRSRVEDKSNQLFGFISSRRVAHLPTTPIWLLYYFPKNMWQSSNTKSSPSHINSVSPSNNNVNNNGNNGQNGHSGQNSNGNSSNGNSNGNNHGNGNNSNNRSYSSNGTSNTSNNNISDSKTKTSSNTPQSDNNSINFLKQENSITINNNGNNNNNNNNNNNIIKNKQKMSSLNNSNSNLIFIKQEGSTGKIPTQVSSVLTPPLNRIIKHKMDIDTPPFLSHSEDLRSPFSSASSPVIHPLLPPNNYLEYGNSLSMPNLLDYQTSLYNMDFWNWESGVNFDNFGVSSIGQDFAHYAIADNSKSQQLFITFNNSVNKLVDQDQKSSDTSMIEKTPQKNFVYKKYHSGDRGGVIAIVGRNEKGKLLYTHNTDDPRCSHLTVTSPKYGFMAGSGNEMDGIATADIGIITVGVQISWNDNNQKVVLNSSSEIEPGKHILVASGLHDFLTVAIPLSDLNQKNIKSVVAMPLQSSAQMKVDENGVVWISAFVHSTPSWLLSFLSSSSANNSEDIAKMIELCCAREMDAKYQNYSNTLEAQLTQLHLSTNQKIEESKLNVENQIKQFTSSLLSSSAASTTQSPSPKTMVVISDEEVKTLQQLIEKNYQIAAKEFRTWKNSIDLNLSSISKLKKFEIKQIDRIKQKLKKGIEFCHPPSCLLYAEIIILSETDIYQHLSFLSQTFKLYSVNMNTLNALPGSSSPFLLKFQEENDHPSSVNSLYDLKHFAIVTPPSPHFDDHLRHESAPKLQSSSSPLAISNPASPHSAPDHADHVATSPSSSDDNCSSKNTAVDNNDDEQNRLLFGKILSMIGVIEYRVGSFENAVELFSRSSDLQYEESFYYLAESHYHAIGVPQNIKKAKKLYSKIAYNFEVPQASYALGLIYYFGIGEELPNYLEAEKHLQFVVDHFIPSASTLREYILLTPSPSVNEQSLSSSSAAASMSEKIPADSTHSEEFTSNIIAESAYFLAMIKLQQKDYQGALSCLNLSADLQNSKAQYQLALLYFEGNNFIQQNLEKSKKFLQLSAQQKYLPSIFALSSLSAPSLSF